jgi:hypothetical protein
MASATIAKEISHCPILWLVTAMEEGIIINCVRRSCTSYNEDARATEKGHTTYTAGSSITM